MLTLIEYKLNRFMNKYEWFGLTGSLAPVLGTVTVARMDFFLKYLSQLLLKSNYDQFEAKL